MARLLVTGGAGYIGSHARLALNEAGHDVVVVDDLREGQAFLAGDDPLVRCDIGDREALAAAFREHGPFQGVLHFAAYRTVPDSVVEPLRYYRNNLIGSATLLEVALAHECRAFVLSSSCAIYGAPRELPIPESAPPNAINPYGRSKWMVEQILADAAPAHGLRWAALRYFNASGADLQCRAGECHSPEFHLIPSALEAAAGLRPGLKLFGVDYPTPDGTCIRDYIHVTDLADAHVRAIERLLEGTQVGARNLGTGVGVSNREVLAAIERVTGRPVPIEIAPRRAGDSPELVADASRFKHEFGWEPAHSDLDTLVASAWRWLEHWKRL